MKTRNLFLSIALLIAVAPDAGASGVGASRYVPVRATQASCDCPTGSCSPGATCLDCARLGFACVDSATPPPCTADGACYPKRQTFGYYGTQWRRWPGDRDSVGPTPADEGEESMLSPFDPPKPEEEDEHAPPPIEDAPEFNDGSDEASTELEIDLPPLPVVRPSAEDAPPALPFGAAPRRSDVQGALPWQTQNPAPVLLPRPMPRGEDAPPALPDSFTRVESPQPIRSTPRRLPTIGRRFDAEVAQATATLPSDRSVRKPIALLPAAR